MRYRLLTILLIVAGIGGCATTTKKRAECPGWTEFPLVNMLNASNVCGHCDKCRG